MECLFKRDTFKIVLMVLVCLLSNVILLYAEVKKSRRVSLSFKKALQLAFKHNRDIAVQENEIRITEAKLLEAKGKFLPQIDFDSSYIHRDSVMNLGLSQGKDSDKDLGVFVGYEDEKSVGISVKQPVFEGGSNMANLRQAKLELEMQRERLRALRLSVEFETKRLYYGILLAQDSERIAEELLNQAKSHYEIVKKKFKEGTASKFDLFQAKVQVSKVFPKVVRAENSKKFIISEFKKLIGLKQEDYIVLKDELTYSFIDLDENRFLEIAYKRNPELIIKSLNVKLGRNNISIAKAASRPHINVNFNCAYRSDDVTDMFNSRHNNWNVGVVVSLPLFDRFSAKAKVEKAKARYSQAELRESDNKRAIALSIKKALLDLRQAQVIIKSQKEVLKEAEEAVKIAEARYRNGVGRGIDVLDAQVSLSQIKNNLSQAIYDYVMAESYLNKVVGGNLFMEGKYEE